VRFWDASALISLCVNDPNAAAMRKLAEEDESIVAWWGTVVECHSAFFRLGRQGELEESDGDQARHLLERLADGWSEVSPGQEVREQAVRLLGLHPLRAADSLQLAAALVWADRRPLGRHFTCLDVRLRGAARREGFTVLPQERRE
jgi:predicted nucleic acid-binding protein